MEDQLRNILADVGGLTVDARTLSSTQNLFAVGLSSFSTVTVMLAIEDEFGVAFPETLLTRETFSTIASLAAAVKGLPSHA